MKPPEGAVVIAVSFSDEKVRWCIASCSSRQLGNNARNDVEGALHVDVFAQGRCSPGT